jgi:hypothetical protein
MENLKVQGMQMVIDAQEDLIKEYEKELKRLRRNNLRLKMHMNVLVHTPACDTARKIRKEYMPVNFSECTIYYN